MRLHIPVSAQTTDMEKEHAVMRIVDVFYEREKSSSRLQGIDPAAPGRVTAIAAARPARSIQEERDLPSIRP